ncbi:CoA transferase subunit A [Mycolicibacterium thermoresistibile]|uniref:Coenzyme a transferase n=1 Tax=Mycolicibacterium thermoresistibile TaxID=1797 RepID=A0A100XF65_MYCTH|nr:CoA-transferase [Mycolicibacterium thermoresistibile]GAT15532.1 coenzyme a transferase [Mycolicibacterium thermoresistibile]
MTPPILSVADAVREYVHDGSCVYVGNFGAQLYGVAHEIIRQRRRYLHMVAGSGGIMLDQLLGAGVVSTATFAHCWNAIGPAPAWNFRRLAESGANPVRLREVSLGILGAALQAGAWRVPFAPVDIPAETGYRAEDWTDGMLATVSSPFGEATVVEAITPDIAFVHVDRVDTRGNGVIDGPHGEAVIAAHAARRTVLVSEEITDPATSIGEASIPGVLVSAIVVAPGSVRPDGTSRGYPREVEAFAGYSAAAASQDGFASWLRRTLAELP